MDSVITGSEHKRHMQCRAVRFGYLGLMCAMSMSLMTAKLLNAMNARSKSRPVVNLSQRRQTQLSTGHTILRCDELTGSRCGCGELVKLNPACAQTTLYSINSARYSQRSWMMQGKQMRR